MNSRACGRISAATSKTSLKGWKHDGAQEFGCLGRCLKNFLKGMETLDDEELKPLVKQPQKLP